MVELGPFELTDVLDRFLRRELTAEELEGWANAVEGRDDIAFRPSEIIDLMAELANPLLFAALTPDTVRELTRRTMTLAERGDPNAPSRHPS